MARDIAYGEADGPEKSGASAFDADAPLPALSASQIDDRSARALASAVIRQVLLDARCSDEARLAEIRAVRSGRLDVWLTALPGDDLDAHRARLLALLDDPAALDALSLPHNGHPQQSDRGRASPAQDRLAHLDAAALEQAIVGAGGTREGAARALGVCPSALRQRIDAVGLLRPGERWRWGAAERPRGQASPCDAWTVEDALAVVERHDGDGLSAMARRERVGYGAMVRALRRLGLLYDGEPLVDARPHLLGRARAAVAAAERSAAA
jgi:hypothetical protein